MHARQRIVSITGRSRISPLLLSFKVSVFNLTSIYFITFSIFYSELNCCVYLVHFYIFLLFFSSSSYGELTGGVQKEEIYDGNASQMTLNDLVRDRNYEIVVTPFNTQGSGVPSSPVTVYVGEAFPTG